MKRSFEQFTNQYPISKILRFELKPVGKTLVSVRNDRGNTCIIFNQLEDSGECFMFVEELRG